MTDASENSNVIYAYRQWAFCDMWPLEDAAVLVSGRTPRDLGTDRPAEPTPQEVRAVYELALNCAGHTLHVERSEARNGELMVEPGMFVTWFEERVGEVPALLRQALDEARTVAKDRTGARPSSLRPEQKHRERTRGAAQCLWYHNRNIRIGDMADNYYDLWKVTCEARSYSHDTIHRWLKEVAPDEASKPGAPRKNPHS